MNVMGENLGKALRAARRAKKLTQAEVGARLGVSGPAVQQWEAGRTEPSPANLKAAAQLLELSNDEVSLAFFEALGMQVKTLSVGETTEIRPEVKSVPKRQFHYTELPFDVPVLGIAVAGDAGDFSFNGDAINYVRRPVGLSYAQDIYAIYAMNDSMFPKYEDGELVFVSPHTPSANGDYVVVEMNSLSDGEVGAGYLKRLVKKTPTKIILEQYNPPLTLEFERSEVKSVHRVVPWREAAGV